MGPRCVRFHRERLAEADGVRRSKVPGELHGGRRPRGGADHYGDGAGGRPSVTAARRDVPAVSAAGGRVQLGTRVQGELPGTCAVPEPACEALPAVDRRVTGRGRRRGAEPRWIVTVRP